MSDAPSLLLALAVLAAALGAAVRRPPGVPDGTVAAAGALLLVVTGVVSLDGAGDVLAELGPTLGFLVALLVLAEGCRAGGLFDAIGARLSLAAAGSERRLLGGVFVAAVGVTTVLGLDATIVLLVPVVLAAAARARLHSGSSLLACAHLANSASLLLPVSNLTNLLALRASGLSFPHFAVLMALPTLVVVAVEWWAFRREVGPSTTAPVPPHEPLPHLPRFPLAVLAATLAGFVASAPLGVDPAWAAVAGAVALTGPELVRRATTPAAVLRAAEPGFLVFVAALGVVVAAASEHGLGSAVEAVIPGGEALPQLLAIAAVSAVLANLVNNLPATLLLLPAVAAAGPIAVLAMLIGVNVGPNLTYAGSLATLLWRRILAREGIAVGLRRFTVLGLRTVPLAVVGATAALWAAALVA